MRTLILLAFLLPLVAGAVVALVLVLVLTGSRRSATTPVGVPAGGRGSWQAQVLGGGLLDSTYGVLLLEAGRLSFFPAGAPEPAWTVPCPELWVRRQGLGPFAVAAVSLHGPMGEVALNVSEEHINRFARNTLKTFRQSGYADGFVAALLAHGARPA